MKLSGFDVSIYTLEEQLDEYSTEISPDGKKATCWIPSQSGKEFFVKYRDWEDSVIKGVAKSIHVDVDGRRMCKHPSLPHHTHGTIRGVYVAEDRQRPFLFAEVQTTDEDTVPGENHANPNEIGTISVQVFVASSWRRNHNPKNVYGIQDHPPAVVDERAKKATDHCVSLGGAQPISNLVLYHLDYNSQSPDLVFEFRYRSVAMLQARGVVPPPKRELPLVIDLEDEDDEPLPKRQKTEHDKDLIRSMQAELKRLRSRLGEFERNQAGSSSVKKEAIKPDPADIIDLT